MKNLTTLMRGVNVAPLLSELLAHPRLWNEHRARTSAYGTPHSAISDIWVRYRSITDVADLPTANEPHESVWYPCVEKLPSLRPLVFDLMRFVEGEHLGGVLITKIPPGGRVAPHVDHGWHAKRYEKVAVQILGRPEQAFCFEEARYVQRSGDVYAFRNDVPHWVVNDSAADRITLICCIRTRLTAERESVAQRKAA